MLGLIRALRRTRVLTAAGLFHLVKSMWATGVNLMTLLRLAAALHPDRIAVVDERDRLSYVELWRQAEALAHGLRDQHQIGSGDKVAIVCRNHVAAITAIFSASRLGAHVFLLNPELSREQLLALEDRVQFDFYVYDEQLSSVFEDTSLRRKSLAAYHPTDDCVDRLSSKTSARANRLRRVKSGNIVVMTGGTTGQPKAASRKPSVFAFLPPFVALLTDVCLDRYRSVYVATPIYHGFGLAAMLMGVVLGTRMHFTTRFNASQSCALIKNESVEVVVVVPLMLQRILSADERSLTSLQCIATGGAMLSADLAHRTLDVLGDKLFNLYGTSEAGFCIMASPASLRDKPGSIGRPISGVRARIVNDSDEDVGMNQVGRLCIRCSWSIARNRWFETGDLAYHDDDSDIFLCGRVDDMIVSGGENVYPIELERVLAQHEAIEAVAVVGIDDPEFGQRLKAVVIRHPNAALNEAELREWLTTRVARYQMPAIVEFRDELPYTSLGKVDRKVLS